ncbi:sec-independent protein translocase protein TatA [Humidesulfovibrio mexicanus]|uniref:Sec-independent protein translocase protein TatA n=1 Tax=Humidesulfovibrio mexicanus TaxID=147047 RepID=A0A238XSG7_9BACT|nr:twin-arginine translocase TatA/TatE family subunit [Humidesulfovibrio mexicanus]SNR61393.1 sec-independent protein translocase protein TatA [Humidesulfovibrio mexicanus]
MGGLTGILIVVIVALIITGSHKLPDLGSGLGRGIKNFKRSLKEPDEIDVTPQSAEKDRDNKPK